MPPNSSLSLMQQRIRVVKVFMRGASKVCCSLRKRVGAQARTDRREPRRKGASREVKARAALSPLLRHRSASVFKTNQLFRARAPVGPLTGAITPSDISITTSSIYCNPSFITSGYFFYSHCRSASGLHLEGYLYPHGLVWDFSGVIGVNPVSLDWFPWWNHDVRHCCCCTTETTQKCSASP